MKSKTCLLLATLLMVSIQFSSCKKQHRKTINPAFREYIQAFTSGTISVKDPIRIRLNNEFVDDALLNLPLEEKYFSFRPDIKGKLYWLDRRTLEFRPDEKLPPDQQFEATFHLSKLISVVDSLKEFEFRFHTMKQNFEVRIENHKAYSTTNLTRERLYGSVITADVTEETGIPEILGATQNGRKLNISWTHDEKNKTHYFQVDSIQRSDQRSSVKLEWNGKSIQAEQKGDSTVEILPLGTFAFTGARVIQGTEKYVLAQFSDPLQEEQNLVGLVSLGRKIDVRCAIEDNELRIYPSEIRSSEITLSIESFLKNIQGKALGKGINEKLNFEDTRPNVRFLGSGVIMPVSKQLTLPFEAVNLRAVDLKIIKIYENNILQFLQVNDLGGQSELARVGKIVIKKTIPLRDVTDYSKWNRFSIDLSELIKPEEGALYCIRLNFKKKYSTYPCSGNSNSDRFETSVVTYGDMAREENQSWAYYGSYDESYSGDDEEDNDYDWENRDNPCKNYYYHSKSVSRNVLASNLGMIAKEGDAGWMMVVVTDILTTKPISGVKLDFYDFQQQLIGTVMTDGDGIGLAELGKHPFIVVAKKENQTGYLKMQEGTSLSLSRFDVSGDQVQKGLKGFLYGDRGVWRPGDSLFLTFILEDHKKSLPANHPVTLTLSNPAGQVVSRIIRTASMNGFYNFSTSTSPASPTGNWMAKVKIGGVEFSKTIKIETVKPNRLRINLNFGTERLVKGKEPNVTLTSSWLTGATARNLKTLITLTMTQSSTAFKKYPGFTFENPSSKFTSEKLTVFEGKLNESGITLFSPQIRMTAAAPGILKANFETTVYEEGGDFSVDRFSLPYYPFVSYAGISVPGNGSEDKMLYTDKTYKVNLVDVDVDGNPIANNTLKVEVLKLDWRWWWDDSDQGANSGFISTAYSQLVDSMTVRITNGKGIFDFIRDHEEWGRYFIRITDKKSGHVAGKEVFVDWYGYSHSPGGDKQAATMLTFQADKEKYKVGEKVKLTFPSSEGGRALLTLENGSTVLKNFWIPTTKGNTAFVFDVTEEMSPNCFAYITLIQPHSQAINDLPIRLYGVIPILVEDPATHLFPTIIMKDILRPEEKAVITVKEGKGLPMTYTLAIVDEGLLDLTRFKTPDPWGTFFAKEALGVKTWDLFDQVMGAYSGELERILSIGGDKDALNKGALKANRFKPMVKFLGPFNLKKGESKTHSFTMPQYVGSVRVMVVAGNNGAYGNSEKTVAVRKPLMVLGTLPRAVSPGETVMLPVTVFAMEKNIRDVNVKITPNAFFSVVGKNSRSVHFSRTGDEIVFFELKVKDVTGIGKVNISATSGIEKAANDIELDVRNPGMPVTNVIETIIRPGATWNGEYSVPGMEGTNKGVVEIYSIPALNLEKRLDYLVNYPHGCVEQITSSVFPQLYLADLADLSDGRKKEIEVNIRAGIQRIREMQIANGGLGLWPGSAYADDWGTSYAGHFLLEAQQKGYTLPMGFLSAWKDYQKQKAISWKSNESWFNNELAQAYRLYTLALAGSPELGAMNKLMERTSLSVATRWRLAAAYQMAGKPEAARKLITTAGTRIDPYVQMDQTYGSEERDEAMIIETLLLMNRRNDASVLVNKISARLANGTWMSTQTTAFALLAVSKFTQGSKGKGIDVLCRINGGKEEKITSSKCVVSVNLDLKNHSGKRIVNITNTGKNILTARIITTGVPPKGDSSAAQSNLKMNVFYLSMEGKTINIASIPQGTNFYAEITVTNPGTRGNYEQMALTQVVASGWEIINARMSDFAASGTNASPFTYQDVRDDRVLTYFDLAPGRSKTFRVMLNASYLGKYYLPPVYCEAMYDNTINARIAGRWTMVTASGK